MNSKISIGDISKLIKTKSLSFESIRKDLLSYIESLPNGQIWKDSFYSTSDGSHILTIAAGISAFKAFHELSRVKESSLDHAEIDTNVLNLAANKGYLIAPSFAIEMNLNCKLNSTATEAIVISEGDIVASLGNYYFYALDSYQVSSYVTPKSIKCVYGYKNEFTQSILGIAKNETFTFTTRDKYLATQLESLTIDDEAIELSSDSSIYEDLTKFMLRRILFHTSKIYLGNGQIGFYNAQSNSLKYSVISFDTDILEKLDDTPSLISPNLILDSKELLLNASFEPDIESIRTAAKYYPIDGRIVRDGDYSSTVLKYFKSYIYDVFSKNQDVTQNLWLLVKPSYTSATKTLIQSFIQKRMGLGIPLEIIEKTVDLGKAFVLDASISSKNNYQSLSTEISIYLNSKLNKFLTEDYTMTSVGLCLELSANFAVKFTPITANTLILLKDDFLKSITMNLTIED